MNAKNNDVRRVQELFAIIQETKARVAYFGLTRELFVASDDLLGRSYADVLLMCVFRATEEAGKMSEEVRRSYPEIPWREVSAMRNVLAHDYGRVDRELIWSSVVDDFPVLEAFCRSFAEDQGIDLDGEI